MPPKQPQKLAKRWTRLRSVDQPAPRAQQEQSPRSGDERYVSESKGWFGSKAFWLGETIGKGMAAVFLPAGFPGTVSPDYLEYQVMDTIQALCSYLRGILATRAVLEGLGVGDASKTVLASTLVWVMKDGVSLLTGLVFSYGAAPRVDASPKFYRLVADLANDIALTLELCAPSLAIWLAMSGDQRATPATDQGGKTAAGVDFAFLCCVCLANALKAICGVSAGCVRVVLTQHFAKQRNAADVNAKESSQETAITLLGIIGGSAALGPLDGDQDLIWLSFLALTVIHVWANWRAVSALQLVTLNENRTLEAATLLLLHEHGAIAWMPDNDDNDKAAETLEIEPTAIATLPRLVQTVNARDPVWPSAKTSNSTVLAACAMMLELAWTTVSGLGFVLWLPTSTLISVTSQLLFMVVPGAQQIAQGAAASLRGGAAPLEPKPNTVTVPGIQMTRAYTGDMAFQTGCSPETALTGLEDDACSQAAGHLHAHGYVVIAGPGNANFQCVLAASDGSDTSQFHHRQVLLCTSLIECLLWNGNLPVSAFDIDEAAAALHLVDRQPLTSSLVTKAASRIANRLIQEWRASASQSGFNTDAVGVAIRDLGFSAEPVE